mmetsp:Transcript_25643/g.46319  ORF Transcript_25643/g.46319 Transcript_25643/m.46319 type:complete len:386 (+) Transcript_25643:509-1666(+)
MMRITKPELKMADLKNAVEEERTSPVPVTSAPSISPTMEPPEKRPRLNPVPPPLPIANNKTHVVTADSVSTEATGLLEIIQGGLPPEISAAWFVRDGDSPPTPPPPLFTPSPPKLTDPTGKDILGPKLALAVILRLLSGSSGTILLQVCRGLWMLSALAEKKANDKIDSMDETMNTQMDELDADLETRLSVAGAASSAVKQMNDNERNAFQQTCYQQRQEALNTIAWDFRNLLCTQQLILTKLQIPGFDGATVDANALELQSRLCSYLHSAFYLRARIGEGPHQAMLRSQAERLRSEIESQSTQPPVESNVPPPLPPFPMQPQQPQVPVYSPAYPQYLSYFQQQQFPGQPIHMMPPPGGAQAPVQQPPNMQQYGQMPPQYYQQQQ